MPGTLSRHIRYMEGTLARDEDLVRSEPLDSHSSRSVALIRPTLRSDFSVLWFAISSTLGEPVTLQDVLRPGDRGFLAKLLKPGTRAISINVDAESGVSSLIRPGDYVDVVFTQEIDKADLDKADLAHRAYSTLSETVLHNVRIIAADQEIVQGEPANNAPANNATAGKPVHPVSLELDPGGSRKSQSQSILERSPWPYRQRSSNRIQGTPALCSVAMCRRNLPAGVLARQRWWFMQTVSVRNTQS